jgi:hypothetical protein
MGSVDAGGACAEAGIEPKIINATPNLVTFSGIFFSRYSIFGLLACQIYQISDFFCRIRSNWKLIT